MKKSRHDRTPLFLRSDTLCHLSGIPVKNSTGSLVKNSQLTLNLQLVFTETPCHKLPLYALSILLIIPKNVLRNTTMAGTRLRKEAKWVAAFSALLAARWWLVNNVVGQTNKSQGGSGGD